MRSAQALRWFVITVALWFSARQAQPVTYQVYFVSIGSGWYVNPTAHGIHGFSRIPGANQSAKIIADSLALGGARYGVALASDDQRFVTLSDIYHAIEQVANRMARDKPEHPLFIFYLASHGISEGIAWNHFSIPGDFVYRGDSADLDIEGLGNNSLYAGTLVDDLQRLHVPFVVLLDSCYDGKRREFESSVLSATATRNLEDTAQVLRALNEFRDTDPVLFSTTPGNSVLTVPNPLEPDSPLLIGPLARRFSLTVKNVLDSRELLTLREFLEKMVSSDLDPLTAPAITRSPIPSEAIATFLIPTAARRPYDSQLGTGKQMVICCQSTALAPAANTAYSIPARGKLSISGGPGEYISSGRTLVVGSPAYKVTVTEQAPGNIRVRFEEAQTEFDASFSTPSEEPFETKEYTSAERWNMANAGHPGLDVSGNARGCGDISGSFKVSGIRYGPDGRLLKFAATFVQVCDASTVPAYGRIEIETGNPPD